jgi:hypothetical protein
MSEPNKTFAVISDKNGKVIHYFNPSQIVGIDVEKRKIFFSHSYYFHELDRSSFDSFIAFLKTNGWLA